MIISEGMSKVWAKIACHCQKLVQGVIFESDELIGYRRRSSKMKNLALYYQYNKPELKWTGINRILKFSNSASSNAE